MCHLYSGMGTSSGSAFQVCVHSARTLSNLAVVCNSVALLKLDITRVKVEPAEVVKPCLNAQLPVSAHLHPGGLFLLAFSEQTPRTAGRCPQ